METENAIRIIIELNDEKNISRDIFLMKKLIEFYNNFFKENEVFDHPLYALLGFHCHNVKEEIEKIGDVFDFFPQYSFIIYNNDYDAPGSFYRYKDKSLTFLARFNPLPDILNISTFAIEYIQSDNDITSELLPEGTSAPLWLHDGSTFLDEDYEEDFRMFMKENEEKIKEKLSRYLSH